MISVLYFIRKISAQYNIKTKNINNNGILRIVLNDPDNKNALSEFMMQELSKVILNASKDKQH